MRERVFLIKLRPLPHCTDPIKALRAALKVLLRRLGLRCIEIHKTANDEGDRHARREPEV
jgi:hypothetical protein